jgi:hypothetical protein
VNQPTNRRELLNQARRRVEKALASEASAEELAAAAEALLAQPSPETEELAALRAAVIRYRAIRPRR